MGEDVKEYIEKYSTEIKELFIQLRTIIYETVSSEVEEKLWAKIPSYYVGEAFIRLIPFKDHINIEAAGVVSHKDELTGYKITQKGMLQIYINQSIPWEVLKQIFDETLLNRN